MNLLWAFCDNETGATIVEYAIMLAMIVAICFAAIAVIGFEAATSWGSSADSVDKIINSNRVSIN